ncbi:MAG: NAD-dependent epimerase/dehydratase family protein, partial [Myxococcota bacterium]|nr:NAD-dependent epimerase/dehydratase family protein [Myxococcota bacterium]
MKVLISGISGGLARQVAQTLAGRDHRVAGLDRRPWHGAPSDIDVHIADIRKRPAEDVFRKMKPDVLVHMATVTHVTAGPEERARTNLLGTRRLFEHCHRYGVKRVVFVGRHTVYGASPDAPLYRTEEEPPLAATTFPELADLVAADHFACSASWRWKDVDTTVLRLVYTLGPSGRGPLGNLLQHRRVPVVMGFDPLFHFIHEQDAALAVALAVEKGEPGVFNVAGPAPVPLGVLCRETGRRAIPIPASLFPLVLGHFGL